MEWRACWSCLRKLGKEKKQVFPQGRIKAFLVRPYFFHTFLLSVVSQKFILFRLRSQNLWFMGNNFSSRRPLNGRAFWSDFALSNNKTLNIHIALFFLFFLFSKSLLFFQRHFYDFIKDTTLKVVTNNNTTLSSFGQTENPIIYCWSP